MKLKSQPKRVPLRGRFRRFKLYFQNVVPDINSLLCGGRSALKLYLIAAAAKSAHVATETARAYCRQGLLQPLRDSAGRRLFTEEDIERIREIYLENAARRSRIAPSQDCDSSGTESSS